MNEHIYGSLTTTLMNRPDFCTIETPPPSSSTSEDPLTLFPGKKYSKFSPSTDVPKSSQRSLCSTATRDDQFASSLYDDMHTTLRRTLGNTKLKTRQDVRRFRKFLKRNHEITSMNLMDINPDRMREYLIDYLTSIRTRKGVKYDPETLRSYYLSIQRFLKDSNYPYCLRNSPQFAQCRELIIQMRKEKNQIKTNDFSPPKSIEMKKKRIQSISTKSTQQPSCSESTVPILSFKDLLPSSSLPLRKRQQMKCFLDFGTPDDFIPIPRSVLFSPVAPPSTWSILSSDAYLLLLQFTHTATKKSSSHHFEQLLDQSPACGNLHRSMLTSLCHEWTGDIRLIHANLRPELNSFLPHILVLNILSAR